MKQPFGNDGWPEASTWHGAGAGLGARMPLRDDDRQIEPAAAHHAARGGPASSPFDVRPKPISAPTQRPPSSNPNGSSDTSRAAALTPFEKVQHASDASPQVAPHAAPKSFRPPRFAKPHPLMAGIAGFVCGMLTWHAVGFWTFVHDVAFNDDKHSDQLVSASGDAKAVAVTANPHTTKVRLTVASQHVAAAQITTGSIAPAARVTAKPSPRTAVVADCILLVRNGTHGDTRPAACPELATPLRDAGRRGRSNRAPDVQARLGNQAAWASATDVSETTAPAPPSPQGQPSDTSWTLTADDRLLDLGTTGASERTIVEPAAH